MLVILYGFYCSVLIMHQESKLKVQSEVKETKKQISLGFYSMETNQELITELLRACQGYQKSLIDYQKSLTDYQKNFTTLLEHPEWWKPYLSVGEAKTSLRDGELSNKDKDTSVEDGDVCSNYGEVAQSTGVEASTSCPIYDDEGVLAPNYDVDSTPYPIYDMYDDAGMIVPEYDKGWELCMEDDNEGAELVDENRSEILYEDDSPHESHHCMVSSSESVGPLCDSPRHVDEITLHDLEDRLLVTEEQIVQVLMRADGAHKFIEDLMWKTQLEERQKGVAGGVTSTQLHIIKEALEQMKSDYLQLFMDRDLALKFVEDKEREVEELCYQLSLAHSSSLTTKTPSSLAIVTHEGVSGTHDLREEPFVTIPHEEHSELQVLEERYDTEGFDYAHDRHEHRFRRHQ
jgi:hypothetical protein